MMTKRRGAMQAHEEVDRPLQAPMRAARQSGKRRIGSDEAREIEPLVRVYCGPRFVGIGERSGNALKPRKVIQC